jgi:uncharacterized Tic20 family protein
MESTEENIHDLKDEYDRANYDLKIVCSILLITVLVCVAFFTYGTNTSKTLVGILMTMFIITSVFSLFKTVPEYFRTKKKYYSRKIIRVVPKSSHL